MRTRTLALGLAAVLAVSCSEQTTPTAPSESTDTPAAQSSASTQGAAVAPRLYVGHDVISPPRVTVVDLTSNTIAATVWLDYTRVYKVAIAPGGGFAYVGHGNRQPAEVFDTETNTVSGAVWCPDETPPTNAGQPGSVVISPDGDFAYVVCTWGENPGGPGFVMIVETASNNVVGTVTVGVDPLEIAMAPDGSEAYVSNNRDGTVSVINTDTRSVVQTIPGVPCPRGIAFTPSGSHAWVTSECAGRISEIDTSTRSVISTVGGLSFPHDLAITQAQPRPFDPPPGPGEEARVYVAGTGGVWEVYTSTAPPTVNYIPLSPAATNQVAITPDGLTAYVGHNSSPGVVSAIDVQTNTVIATISVPGYPRALAVTQTLSPAAQVEALSGDVADLVASGALDEGNGNALQATLDNVAASLAKDKPNVPNLLNAFINKVQGFVNGGILSPAEGQSLIDAAQTLIGQLES